MGENDGTVKKCSAGVLYVPGCGLRPRQGDERLRGKLVALGQIAYVEAAANTHRQQKLRHAGPLTPGGGKRHCPLYVHHW